MKIYTVVYTTEDDVGNQTSSFDIEAEDLQDAYKWLDTSPLIVDQIFEAEGAYRE